ncbi:uncharacterized protein LOC129748913 [Uranotaenia lowii]|uniref:uncharacterized protein LOC129748913 n=1 Tax=Uranotaenia lowii TaxID=190385 RepID=UPI002478E306|nr:uncharacterized protein LOC129748913 [Uranotaenia lowii]
METDAVSAKLVKENEVPMVSMDGEGHPEITLAAVGLGALVAFIILITLIALISRRKRHMLANLESTHPEINHNLPNRCKRASTPEIFTISREVQQKQQLCQSRSCRNSSSFTIRSDVVTQI